MFFSTWWNSLRLADGIMVAHIWINSSVVFVAFINIFSFSWCMGEHKYLRDRQTVRASHLHNCLLRMPSAWHTHCAVVCAGTVYWVFCFFFIIILVPRVPSFSLSVRGLVLVVNYAFSHFFFCLEISALYRGEWLASRFGRFIPREGMPVPVLCKAGSRWPRQSVLIYRKLKSSCPSQCICHFFSDSVTGKNGSRLSGSRPLLVSYCRHD